MVCVKVIEGGRGIEGNIKILGLDNWMYSLKNMAGQLVSPFFVCRE